jgi:hypothetical protein
LETTRRKHWKIHKDLGIDNAFLNRTPISQETRSRIDKLDHIKLKIFCTAKETITRIKRQPTEWERIFTSYSSDKGLQSRIYKELQKLSAKRQRIKLMSG